MILEINYTEEQMKAVSYHIINPLEWIQHAWDNKARQCIDRIVEKVSDKQAKKISDVEKNQIIKDTVLDTATERESTKKLG